MAWKTINGRQYYYRSVRVGSRVRSEYYGVALGEVAAAFAREDDVEKLLNRTQDREEREEWDEIDRALDELARDARHLAEGVLVANGYHKHNRSEWRKRRA